MDAGTWLIVGGGGLDGGRRDTVGLRLVNSTKGSPSGLEWFACGEVQRGSALAAEGMSVVRVGGSNPGHVRRVDRVRGLRRQAVLERRPRHEATRSSRE